MSKQPVTKQSASEQSNRNGIALPDPGDEKEFRELLQEWDQDTAVHSDAPKILRHPAYQKIVTMGQRAIPLILRELKEGGGYFAWFAALEAITKEDPVPEGAQDGRTCREAWLKWGRDRGQIE